MASNGPTPAPRRSSRPPPVLLAALALASACGGFAFAGLTAEDPSVPQATASPGEVVRASGETDRRAEANETRRLGRSLAAARAHGGSPVAAVTRRTALRAAPGGRALDRLGTETEFGSSRVHAVVGRRGAWLEVMAAELPNGRTGWLRARHVDVGGVDYSVRASLGERQLEVRRRGRVVRRLPVAIGGPATPTPPGEYAVTDRIRMRDEGSAYGCCALAFTGHQPNVPQGWAGGDRLAVHGTPDEATVGAAGSLGCFRAREADMRWLIYRVPLGAPVTVTP